MRLVDADALKERYYQKMKDLLMPTRTVDLSDNAISLLCGSSLIIDAPTVDAVPVVRCKDCKYFIQTVFLGNKMNACRFHGSSTILPTARIVTDDWFCADGERREE